jgi:hypothetical protein
VENKKEKKKGQPWWFKPIILAIWEAEIRRITVRGQLEWVSN